MSEATSQLKNFTQPDGSFKIEPDMIIADVISAFPRTAGVFMAHGLHCVGCAANAFDTVEGGAKLHGMPDEEITSMIAEANELINKHIDLIEITPTAIVTVKELRANEKGKEDWPLRIVVTKTPDGFSYDMDFAQREEHDTELEVDGLLVLIAESSLPLLRGSSIDYIESAMGSGFKIDNPNAQKHCACGSGSCGCR